MSTSASFKKRLALGRPVFAGQRQVTLTHATCVVIVIVLLALVRYPQLWQRPLQLIQLKGRDHDVQWDPAEVSTISQPDVGLLEELDSSSLPRLTAGPEDKRGILEKEHQLLVVPESVAQHVKRLILFVGYPRSCHSLVASLLDAHPHVVVSHEYDLVGKWQTWSTVEKANRTFLVNKLFRRSRFQALHGLRSAVPGSSQAKLRKDYSYGVPHQWQGNFRTSIELVGDKHGGRTSKHLSGIRGQRQVPLGVFDDMERKQNISLVFIHVMRHPYDNIATMALRQMKKTYFVNGNIHREHLQQGSQARHLHNTARTYCNRFASSVAAVRSRYSMVDVRCEDLVHDPVKTLQTLCRDLRLSCSDNYLTDCSGIVSNKPSRTREFVTWPTWLKREIAANLSKYSFISERYRF